MLSIPTRATVAAALLAAVLPVVGCDRAPTGPEDALLTVSGTLDHRSGKAVPADARVVVAWEVASGSPDYLYVFGEGTVRDGGKTFQVSFDQPPPAEALNSNGLGVGIVLLTTAAGPKPGTRLEAGQVSTVLGAAGQYAVIYVQNEPAATGGWAASFPKGYSVGKGVKQTTGFDTFQPTSRTSVEIIVDALSKIDFVNWT